MDRMLIFDDRTRVFVDVLAPFGAFFVCAVFVVVCERPCMAVWCVCVLVFGVGAL